MKTVDFKRLRLTIILCTLGFSLLPLLVLGLTVKHRFAVGYQEALQGNLRTLVESKRNAIDLFLTERQAQVATLASALTLEEASDKENLERVFSQLQATSRYYIDLGVIGMDGNHLAYAGPYDLSGRNYKNEDWFAKVTAKGVYVSDVFLGFRQYPHIIIAVLRREGGKSWILRATIDSDIFESFVKRVQMGRTGDAFLVNEKLVLQTSPRFGGHVLEDMHLPFRVDGRFQGLRVEQMEVNHRPFLYGWTWLENKDWLLVIREDPVGELRPLFDAEYLVWVLMAGGVAVIVAGTVLVTNSMVGRLEKAEREMAALDASLTQSGKMAALGKMAAGVAHEINNPLAIIREQAGWIKDLLEESELAATPQHKELSESVHRIEHHVERAKNVTHRMLGFARRMEPVMQSVDVNKLLAETVQFLKTEALLRNIDIRQDFAEHLPPTNSDPTQLQQVLLNLIDNAIDAVGKNGRIVLTTRLKQDSNELRVTVADTGCGIPPDKLDKIFDPFFTTKKPGEGTGLGLSISFGIIEKLGGRITVQSVVGQGTTFDVYVPAA
ncbi:Sensor protein ZraS [Fundidesulfovibrio magnetotacticus]|uniref:histidine kinase n=1 Tax=Fundidesulfovibrio magnetotacticus TaxID=2730080 RepID=A0A6V8LQS1_9BACT|nr:PAS domain-containing sensor histidine kinase [Fundidesulfovibrio magnetotacticus]GFK94074.1 Sensor protein ZraS [Fundidesulfovibrio magnetotacticus]